METKVCKTCGRELPLSDFPTNNATADGKDHRCKECKNAYMKEWQKKNREKKKAQKIENERVEFEKKYKIYTCKKLAPFTPRELMLELKARGYTGDLLYQEIKVTEHRINLSKLE